MKNHLVPLSIMSYILYTNQLKTEATISLRSLLYIDLKSYLIDTSQSLGTG